MARSKNKRPNTNKKPEKPAEFLLVVVPEAASPSKEVELEVLNPEVMDKPTADNPSDWKIKGAAFDLSSLIYLEIHRGNIFHYFSSAMLAPASYFERRAFEDVQSRVKDYMLLANGSSVEQNDNIVLLQLELTEEEKNALDIQGSVAYLARAVPVTRICKIIAISEKVKKSIISDALVFSGGFIPEKLFSISIAERNYDIGSVKFPKAPAVNQRHKIKRFDHMLGLFAFLRNYSLLVSDKTSLYKSLPDHFVYAMQALNPKFGSQIVPQNSISDFYAFLFNENTPSDKPLLKWIFERIAVDDNFHDQDTTVFEKVFSLAGDEITQTGLASTIFESLRQGLERKSILSVIEISKSKSALPLYIFAFLRNYANLNSIEIARRDIPNVVSPLYGEYAFALLGYFYGYAVLKNTDEKITLANPAIAHFKLNERKSAIKFHLESDFDCAVIDQVYQKVFGGNLAEVANIEGKLLTDNRQTLPGDLFEVGVQSFELIDTAYMRISVKSIAQAETQPASSPQIDVRKELPRVPERIAYLSDLGMLCRRMGLAPISTLDQQTNLLLLSPAELVNKSYYKKSDMLKKLEERKSPVGLEELKTRLLLAKMSGEL